MRFKEIYILIFLGFVVNPFRFPPRTNIQFISYSVYPFLVLPRELHSNCQDLNIFQFHFPFDIGVLLLLLFIPSTQALPTIYFYSSFPSRLLNPSSQRRILTFPCIYTQQISKTEIQNLYAIEKDTATHKRLKPTHGNIQHYKIYTSILGGDSFSGLDSLQRGDNETRFPASFVTISICFPTFSAFAELLHFLISLDTCYLETGSAKTR